MFKRIFLAIGIAVAVPSVATAIAVVVVNPQPSARIQPAGRVKETPSTILQNPNGGGADLGVPAPSQLQGGGNVQGQ